MRIRFGGIALPSNLKKGNYMAVNESIFNELITKYLINKVTIIQKSITLFLKII